MIRLTQLTLIFLWLIIAAQISCYKKNDEPPEFTGPDIVPNFSIADLKKKHFSGNFEKITEDYVIEGIIIADDASDNFYKSVVLQDSTGGVTVRMDAAGLYGDYPIGRRVAVKLNGLWLGDYGGMLQIGAAVDRTDPQYPELTGIPLPLFSRFIVKKELNNTVIAKPVRLDELNDTLQNCLVKMNDLEFAVSDTGKTYADAVNKLSVNRTLKVCGIGSIYLRTGGYAGFANIKLPRGNGSVTAVYTVFNKEKQLIIRDTSDMDMNGLRCTGSGPRVLLNEDFETVLVNTDINAGGWKNFSEIGGRLFAGKLSGGNHYAEIGASATAQPSVISWLISPAVNLAASANEILSFQTKDGFDNGAVLQAYISVNYDGISAPTKARWVPLKAVISKGSVQAFASDWVGSGNISLSGYSGVAYIGFRYEGADPAAAVDKRTTVFQLDNVRIVGN